MWYWTVPFQYCCTVETGTVPIPYSRYTVSERYRTVQFCTSFRYHSSAVYWYRVPDDQYKHGTGQYWCRFLVYSKKLIQKRTVLLDTNCRNTVLSNTVFVSSSSIQIRSNTKMVQSVTTQYMYSTGQYCVYRYWAGYGMNTVLTCIDTVPNFYYSPVFIRSYLHPFHFKMALMYHMYHKFSRSKLRDVNCLYRSVTFWKMGVSGKKAKRKTDSVYIVIQMFIHDTIKKKYKVYRQGILTLS